jgi:hypothetical protein
MKPVDRIMNKVNMPFAQPKRWGIAIIILVIVVLLGILSEPHWYLFKRVNPDQIGIKTRGGKIVGIVPAGVYSDVGLFVDLQTYSTLSYQFTTEDPEVITQDNQRLGVTVSGSAFRPYYSMSEGDIINLWIKYRSIFTNDQSLQSVLNDLSTQSMKVCVGNKPFRESVIGSERDSLRTCIDEELNRLSKNYGLTVTNVTVPNVALSPEVQALLDSITKSRLETEKAAQDKLKADAEGLARKAEQEANIRVEQSKIQEETRQQIILAQLNEEKLKAQLKVIEADKANSLLSAQKDLEINTAMSLAASERAKADLAKDLAQAAIYTNNPVYAAYMMALVNASAIKESDKFIFTPEGVFPQLVFGSDGLFSTVPVPK